MRVNLVPESARHLEMTRARQMRVDTRDLAEAIQAAQRVLEQRKVIISFQMSLLLPRPEKK